MKNTTERIAESVKTFTEIQKEMFNGMFTENPFKVENPFSTITNHNEIMENTIKFHTASIDYHKSIITMLEAMNALNPVKTNKK
jgi:hypothetical protein